MSISTIVTRGYGSYGSVYDLPTRGYSISAIVPAILLTLQPRPLLLTLKDREGIVSGNVNDIAEGIQQIRLGEGIIWQLATTNWASSPSAGDIVITRVSDSTDVTADFTSTATPQASGDNITLPEITIPTDAELGDYQVDMPFTAGGFSPGIPFFILEVKA